MSDRWDDEFQRDRARQIATPAPPAAHTNPDYRVAGWGEIAAWCRENGVKFDGFTVHPVNMARRARGRKPYALAKGPIQKGFRGA